jgi:DNA repair photolyase
MVLRKGLSVSITTKSNQVVRDLDLLLRIAAHSTVHVNLSITTLRPRLARMLEPRAPRPDLRLQAVRELRNAGIAAGVFAMPVLPGLTDAEADLDVLARAMVRRQGAVSDALRAEAVPAVSICEVPKTRATLSRMVFPLELRS